MSYRAIEPLSKQLTIIIGLTVVGFMAFGLALSFYRNLLFDQTLENIAKQNTALRAAIDNGYRELEYYRSTQYKDKYAKENLGRVSPGEKVLIILPLAETDVLDENMQFALDERREAAYQELLRQMPIIEHWKLYLFRSDAVEALKQGLSPHE